MNSENGLQPVMNVAPSGSGGGFGGFGGDGWWIILLFLIWGNNGWGNNGGQNGGVGSEVQRGFDHSATITKLDGLTNGLSDLGYAIQAQNASCCCETQRLIERGFCDTQNAINNSTRAILDYLTGDKIATLQTENQTLKFQASQANQNAYLTATMDANTAELLRRINPTPVPAYSVPAPYPYGGYGCGYGNAA